MGSAAVQLAHAAGARVFATASGPKRDAVMALGTEVVVDHRSEDFQAVVLAATGGRGVDVVIDLIGAPSLERNVRSLAEGGRLVCVGLPALAAGTLRPVIDCSYPLAEAHRRMESGANVGKILLQP